MFLHKQRTLSAVIFLFLSLVLSLLCIVSGYIRMLYGNVCVVVHVANIKTLTDKCHAFLFL